MFSQSERLHVKSRQVLPVQQPADQQRHSAIWWNADRYLKQFYLLHRGSEIPKMFNHLIIKEQFDRVLMFHQTTTVAGEWNVAIKDMFMFENEHCNELHGQDKKIWAIKPQYSHSSIFVRYSFQHWGQTWAWMFILGLGSSMRDKSNTYLLTFSERSVVYLFIL